MAVLGFLAHSHSERASRKGINNTPGITNEIIPHKGDKFNPLERTNVREPDQVTNTLREGADRM